MDFVINNRKQQQSIKSHDQHPTAPPPPPPPPQQQQQQQQEQQQQQQQQEHPNGFFFKHDNLTHCSANITSSQQVNNLLFPKHGKFILLQVNKKTNVLKKKKRKMVQHALHTG
jgi:hypothetical protein